MWLTVPKLQQPPSRRGARSAAQQACPGISVPAQAAGRSTVVLEPRADLALRHAASAAPRRGDRHVELCSLGAGARPPPLPWRPYMTLIDRAYASQQSEIESPSGSCSKDRTTLCETMRS